MLELQHYLPEVVGGAGAYAVHAASHRLYHVVGSGLIRSLKAARRSAQR